MPNPSLETLGIRINAESKNALNGIVNLAQRLESLSKAVASVETGKINDIASSIGNLGTSLSGLSGYVSFSRLVDNINKLNNVDLAQLPGVTQNLQTFFQAMTPFNNADSATKGVLDMATALGKFGGANIRKAAAQIPALTQALKDMMAQMANAPTISQNTLDFTRALTELAAQGQHAGTAARGLAANTKTVSVQTDIARKKSLSLASAIGRMYAKYMLIIRGIKKLGDSIKATSDYIEAYNYFNVAFNKIGDEWKHEFTKYGYDNAEAYADSFGERLSQKFKQMSGLTLDLDADLIKTTDMKSLGLNLTEITQYASAIGSITNAIGLTGEASLATSKAVTMLSADLGSLMNIDYKEVSGNLQSALNGQARALYKYGIDTTNASLQAYAYANGVQESVNNLSQASKLQLRLLAILDQSKVAWADLAHTIESPNNQLRQLKNNLSELGQVIGQLFIPILSKVLPYINGVTIALKRLMVSLAEILGIRLNLDDFGQGWTDNLEDIEEDLGDVGKAAKDAKKSIREFDELKVIGGKDAKDIGSGVKDIDLTTQILDAVSEYEKVWDKAYEKMTVKAQEIADALSGAFTPIEEIFKDFSIGDFYKASEDISDLLVSIEDGIDDLINDIDWDAIGTKIGDFIKGIKWGEILKGLGQIILDAISAAFELGGAIFNAAPVETAVLGGIGLIKWFGLDDLIGETLGAKIGETLAHYLPSTIVSTIGLTLSIGSMNAIIAPGTDVNLVGDELKTLFGNGLLGAGTGMMLGKLLGIGASALWVTIPLALTLGIVELYLADNIENQQRKREEWEKFLDEIGINDIKAKITGVEIDHAATKKALEEALSDTDITRIEELADKYFELSSNYANLTDEEKGLLKFYADELSSSVDGITGYIDEITGAWKGTEEQLDALIDKQLSYYKMQAYGQAYSDSIMQQINAEKALADAERERDEDVAIAESKRMIMIDRLNSVYQRLTRESKDFAIEVEKGNITFEDFVNKALGSQIQGKSGFTYTRTEGKYAGMDKSINLDTDTQKYIKEYLDYLNAANEATIEAERANNVLSDINANVAEWEGKLAEYSSLYYQDAVDIGTETANGLEDSKALIEASMNEIYTTINNGLDGIKDGKLKEDTLAAMEEIKNSIANGKKPSEEAMKKVRNGIAMALDKLPNGRVKDNIAKTMDNIEQGIYDGNPNAVAAMLQLMIDINSALSAVNYDQFKVYGSNISSAILNGLRSKLNEGLSDIQKTELEYKYNTSAYLGEFGNLTPAQIADTSALNVALKNGSYDPQKNYLKNFSLAEKEALYDKLSSAYDTTNVSIELGVNADKLLEILSTEISKSDQKNGKKSR